MDSHRRIDHRSLNLLYRPYGSAQSVLRVTSTACESLGEAREGIWEDCESAGPGFESPVAPNFLLIINGL